MSTMSCVVYTRAGAGSDSASVFSVFSVPDASELAAVDSFAKCAFLTKLSNSVCDSVSVLSEAAICASCAL